MSVAVGAQMRGRLCVWGYGAFSVFTRVGRLSHARVVGGLADGWKDKAFRPVRLLVFAGAVLASPASAQGVTGIRTASVPQAKIYQMSEIVSSGDLPFVGVNRAISSGAGGLLYVPLPRIVTIAVYSPSGSFVGKIGRHGQGPGEFLRFGATDLRNDTLFIWDYGQGRITTADAISLRVLNTARLETDEPGPFLVLGFLADGSILTMRSDRVQSSRAAGEQSSIHTLMRVDPRGGVLGTLGFLRFNTPNTIVIRDLYRNAGAVTFPNPLAFKDEVASSDNGRWIVIVKDLSEPNDSISELEIRVIDIERNHSDTLRLNIARRRLERKFVDRWVEQRVAESQKVPRGAFWSAPPAGEARSRFRRVFAGYEFFPGLTGVRITNQGSVWLKLTSSMHDRESWLAVDSEARIYGRVVLPAGVKLLVAESGNYVWSLRKNELDIPSLVRWAVYWQ